MHTSHIIETEQVVVNVFRNSLIHSSSNNKVKRSHRLEREQGWKYLGRLGGEEGEIMYFIISKSKALLKDNNKVKLKGNFYTYLSAP